MTCSPLPDEAVLRRRVNDALAVFLRRQAARCIEIDESLRPVAQAIDDFVLGGGKRLRPAFAYWGFRGAGGADSDAVIAAVSALELVQTSALVHDDVIDASDTRRGRPTIHRRFASTHRADSWHGDPDAFGTAAAILLGDLCLVWSDELLHTAGLGIDAIVRARPIFDDMRTEVTLGQYLDVQTQATGETSTDRAALVARYKSAKYTVERPLLFGAALAGAPAELVAAYRGFGLPLGEAFQLRDDVLGVFGDPAVTGKPAGDDLREGKRTWLVAAALQVADGADRHELTVGLGDPGLDGDRIKRLREIIVATGALRRTERRIAELHATALAALASAPAEPATLEVLVGLATKVVQREV